MNEKKLQLVSMIIAVSTFCAACEIDNNKNKDYNVDFEAPNVTTNIDQTESNTIIEETVPILTEPETTEPETTEPEITEPEITEPETTEPETTEPEITEPEIIEPESKNFLVKATDNVNIRTNNTTDALKIGNLNIGETAYKILSCDNNWDLIKGNGIIGYVCRDYLEYHSDAQNDEYEHQLYNDIVLTTTNLNFRKGPDISCEKIDLLKENTELQVIAKTNNGWYLVNYNGTLGYISNSYTESILDNIKEEYPDLDLKGINIEKVVYTNASKLNIRNGNSTDYEIIGELTNYETARVLKEIDDWYFVLTNNYELGFISKAYTKELTDRFVIVDLNEQRLWLYNNKELYLTTPVTTGKDSTPSDIGYFSIYSKETNQYLVGPGYRSFVEYWMPYNGGEGLHDASWRSVFGTDDYITEGSHGCINLPPEIADDIYKNIEVGTKVLVHK